MRLIALTLFLSVSFAFGQNFPLSIHQSGRYLVDVNGNPFFLVQESAWSLLEGCTVDTADVYLRDRQARGVNALITMLPAKQMADYPLNASGQTIWSGTPYLTPNEAYFAHADSVLNRALQRGFFVWIAASYLGFDTSQGFRDQITARTAAQMKSYGIWLGNRYKHYPNIGWFMGGDLDPTNWQVKIDSMVAGLRSVDTIYPRLYTTHNEGGVGTPGVYATSHGWGNRSWLNVNGLYDYSPTLYADISNAWDMSPVRPTFLFDGIYEQPVVNYIGGTTDMLVIRKQYYWTVLRGSLGITYGNDPLWGFGFNFRAVPGGFTNGGDWYPELSSPGTLYRTYAANLYRSRHWWQLVPNRDSTIMTAGSLSGNSFAVTARTADSSSIVSYLPTRRSVTINPAGLKGDSLHLWWFNPSTGVATDGGVLGKSIRVYTPPALGDWVLVLDSKAFPFNQPGNIGPVPVAPPNSSSQQPLNIGLRWNRLIGSESYHVQLALDSNFANLIVDDSLLVDTTRTFAGLFFSTRYFWRVNSSNQWGVTPWSAVWSFNTESLLAQPSLSLPVNGATSVSINPLLMWLSVPGASSYDLEIARDSTFRPAIASDSLLAGNAYQLYSLDYAATFFWHVRARSSAGQVTPYSPSWRFTTLTAYTHAHQVRTGWNLVSLPVRVADPRKAAVFPTATSSAFSYSYPTGYSPVDSLFVGLGYWLRFAEDQTVGLQGSAIAADTIPVAAGWNLIGSVTADTDTSLVTTIPPGIRVSAFFGFNGSLNLADSILAGRGYWVKMASGGSLILAPGVSGRNRTGGAMQARE